MDDREPLDDDLLRSTGNPRLAEALKDGLRRLSKSTTQPELAEMARDLLAGRTTLREVAGSEVYGSHLRAEFAKFQDWQNSFTPAERQELAQKARQQFEEPDTER